MDAIQGVIRSFLDWRVLGALLLAFTLKYLVEYVTGANSAPPKKVYSQAKAQADLEKKLRPFTLAEISKHNTPKDLWLVVEGQVYDVTKFAPEHPGELAALMRWAGKDCTDAFFGDQHPDTVREQVRRYHIGYVEK